MTCCQSIFFWIDCGLIDLPMLPTFFQQNILRWIVGPEAAEADFLAPKLDRLRIDQSFNRKKKYIANQSTIYYKLNCLLCTYVNCH